MKRFAKCAFYMVVLCAFFVLSSCSKDESNPVGPTVEVKISGELVSNNNGFGVLDTILKADLLFDGNVISSVSSQSGNYNAKLEGTVKSVKKGKHTISFRITNQTSTPNYYGVYDVVVIVEGSKFEQEYKFDRLETGKSIEYSITIE